MKRINVLAVASLTGVALARSVVSPAFAWHPKGNIVKSVQNQTAGGELSDANDAAHAVSAKPGDILKYVIEVSNVGAADSHGYNDMAKTVMTDTLPAGVQLINDPAQTKISEDLGTLTPGQKVTKTYMVKVVADKDGTLIQNQACFTGNSKANDNPQKGCDVADVKVHVPTPPVTPTTPNTPEQPAPQVQAAATTQPATLPNTGAGNVIAPVMAAVIAAAAYAWHVMHTKKRVAFQRQR
jgi:uncharacterized repeat protein (TIGR01451 family)